MNSEYTTMRVFKADRDRLEKLEQATGYIVIGGNGNPYVQVESLAQILERILVEWEILRTRIPVPPPGTSSL